MTFANQFSFSYFLSMNRFRLRPLDLEEEWEEEEIRTCQIEDSIMEVSI